jgi:hypothetical protein
VVTTIGSEEIAMYETHVTVVGNVVTPINPRRLADGTLVANFRVGSSERRYDRATGGWIDATGCTSTSDAGAGWRRTPWPRS